MTYSLADRIKRAVVASGLPYTEVPGWKSRGRGTMGGIRTVTIHHTATPRSFRKGVDYPTMGVVRDGRPGIPGPLSQLGLGRSGRVYLIAAGIANHAGRSLATSMTNRHAIGIEAEGAMEPWPKAQYDAYVRLARALKDEFGAQVLGHKETASPRGRKADPSFSMPQFRRDIANLTTTVELVSEPTEPEGIFDIMTTPITGGYAPDQQVPAKTRQLIRIAPNGAHRFAPADRGRKVTGNVTVEIFGLAENESAEAFAVICDKQGRVIHTFERHVAPARVHGWPVTVTVPVNDQSGKAEGAEYRILVHNPNSHPITVSRATRGGFHS